MRNVLSVAAILVAASSTAQAGAIFFSNAAAWDAAVSGIATTNFEGLVSPDGVGFREGTPGPLDPYGYGYAYLSSPFDSGGIIFGVGPTSQSGALFLVGDAYDGFGKAMVSSQGGFDDVNNDLLVTLPGATAVAFNFVADPGKGFSSDPGPITITLSDGSSKVLTTTGIPTDLFVGVIDFAGITSVDITKPFIGDAASIEIGSFSTASATPEPASLLLFGAGLAGMIGIARRRRIG